MDNINSTTSDVQWPVSKPRNRVPQILLGFMAVLFVLGVAGAAYYVSNQLSQRQAVGPTGSQASGGCTNNPKQCKAGKEFCDNGVCRPIPTAPPAYRCTATNCPGPAFYCSSSTNCANSPGWLNGQPIGGTPQPTSVGGGTATPTTCSAGQQLEYSCTTTTGLPGNKYQPCCSNNTFSGCPVTECFPSALMPTVTVSACSAGYSCFPGTPSNTGCTITCIASNGEGGRCCPGTTTSSICTQTNLFCSSSAFGGATNCRTSGANRWCCPSNQMVNGVCTSGTTTTPTTTTTTKVDSCSPYGTCKNYAGGLGCTNAGGDIDNCTTSTGSSGNCCVPVSGGATPAPTTGGGGVGPTTAPGGGGTPKPGGGGTPPPSTSTTTPAPTATPTPIPPVGIAGACMEIQLYSKNADGTFSTTPMTAQQRQSIKIGDTIRMAIRTNRANLQARFRVFFNNVVMSLPGPVVYTDAPNQRPRLGFLDPSTRLISYYDFTATRAGEYKFEGYVSTSPQAITCGGIAGVICPTGYTCNAPRNVPDATGTCVPVAR